MSQPTSDFALFAGAWGAYIAWGLTLIGWFVSHRLTSGRELRKERKSEIDACAKMATELVSKARQYYTIAPSDPKCPELESQIKFDLYRLMKRVERLEAAHAEFDTDGIRQALMDSLVGDTFESARRVPVTHSNILLITIESDVHQLIDTMEDGFSKAFKS